MSQIHKHSIPANIAERCLINPEQYQAQYQQSVTDPDAFWGEQGKILDWIKPYTRVKTPRSRRAIFPLSGMKTVR